ncbi:NAD(P)/FAD-dependent oxidoreductase [Candidatus Thiodiazotropha sp. CDECU1]|uniref:NAD(P)/FAD-dependent oxidoreductase n=1 Tax=Candidatus Thiodiazotropha sp. CDECU1 TaxID=3065865 RepID=UPI00292D46AF|nr:NAD(P)/FAD-dependent oxidoreductase [Candidatus Thiodiazotropha sp. CDECU1]
MTQITRRKFVKAAGACAALGAIVSITPQAFGQAKKGRVIVIGGGYGGAIAAKYIKMADPDIDVLLIEKNANYVSCPMSNEVLGGDRDIESITFGYAKLNDNHGINVVTDEVVSIDPDKHSVKGKSGKQYNYDKLVVSPGIEFRYDKIEGYSAEVAEQIPHAWKAGPQTLTLRKQLTAMKDGGVCYIVAPPNPFRCPPGPYERAAQIAHYFKQHKPKSKVIILDTKDKFSKQGLFMQGYKKFYGDTVEWVAGAAGGIIEGVDAKSKTLIGQVDEYQGDVVNIIPAQKAGKIAQIAGLTDDSGWCPVDQMTFESSIHKDIHVIGDACIAGKMPKSGYAANSQGKVCAAAVVAALNGNEPGEPSYVNTCYSIIAPEWGISVAAVYQLVGGKIVGVKGAGGLSPMNANAQTRAIEAKFAHSWFTNITADMFT